MSLRGLVFGGLLAGFMVSRSLGCGPFFPEDALTNPRAILQPPLFHFEGELYQLRLPAYFGKSAPGTPAYTLEQEMLELEPLLPRWIPEKPARDQWMANYRRLRRAMLSWADRSAQAMQEPDATDVASWPEVRDTLAGITNPLPPDMRLYLEGAGHWVDALVSAKDGKPDAAARDAAIASWSKVLELPPADRQLRSTWAAWMLFRSAEPVQQGRWLVETRRLSGGGFKDCLHFGVEATYILGRPGSDYPERETVSSTDWKRAAIWRAMLGMSHRDRVLSDRIQFVDWAPETATQVLADPFLRRVQLLVLIHMAQSEVNWEQGVPEVQEASDGLARWLESFEQAEVRDQREASLLAWIFYQAGRFDEARRWLKFAPAGDPEALALRAKLAAMRGDRQDAGHQFDSLSRRLDTPDRTGARAEVDREGEVVLGAWSSREVKTHRLLADCAVAQVSRNHFAQALATFLRTDYWNDAAYIAERLLSVDELLALSRAGKLPRLDRMSSAEETEEVSVSRLMVRYEGWNDARQMPERFTYLVARRLAREGRYREAAKLLPSDLSLALDRYARERETGENRRLPAAHRAEALWIAAQLQRHLGMELFGFEGAPDGGVYGGQFEPTDFFEYRESKAWLVPWISEVTERQISDATPVFPVTSDERWAANHYRPSQDKRFHYRYEAAGLAWKAAELLPDNDERTARILCVAGSWLKNRDSKVADRFYEALVSRNPDVPLAQEAKNRRWFPPIDSDFNLRLR